MKKHYEVIAIFLTALFSILSSLGWERGDWATRAFINVCQGFVLAGFVMALTKQVLSRKWDNSGRKKFEDIKKFTDVVLKKVTDRAVELRGTATAYAQMGLANEANETLRVADELLNKTLDAINGKDMDEIVLKLKVIDSAITAGAKP